MSSPSIIQRQSGESMIEYIIIVGLIAVAAVAVYQFLGQSIRSQTAGITKEVAGQSTAVPINGSPTAAVNAKAESTTNRRDSAPR